MKRGGKFSSEDFTKLFAGTLKEYEGVDWQKEGLSLNNVIELANILCGLELSDQRRLLPPLIGSAIFAILIRRNWDKLNLTHRPATVHPDATNARKGLEALIQELLKSDE